MKIIIYLTNLILICSLFQGCSIEPQVYDELSIDDFPENETQLERTIAPAYVSLRNYCEVWNGVVISQELSSDEMVMLTRGGDWSNGGVYKRLFTHTTVADNGPQNGIWSNGYNAISSINLILYQLEQTTIEVATLKQKIAELKVLRAFWYFLLFDNYRNIYIKTDFTDVSPAQQVDAATVFAFIEKEIKDNMDQLIEDNNTASYGLVTKGMARTLLAKLYLNAEVYIGSSKWQDCIDQCDAVINSNQYGIFEDGYAKLFSYDNDANGSSKENIFVVPFDVNYKTGFYHYIFVIHFNSGPTYQLGFGGWNGLSTLSDFVRLYDVEDVRRKETMIEGQQYSYDGKIALTTRQGTPLNYTIEYSVDDPWNEKGTGGCPENEGVRILKYIPGPNSTADDQGNDFVIFRYADVLLMKAEALCRLGKNAEALPLMNQIRLRALPSRPFETVNLDSVYLERRRELAGEGLARQDMIRFGKFEGVWQFHPTPSDLSKRIFPIPLSALTVNPTLVQNPGY